MSGKNSARMHEIINLYSLKEFDCFSELEGENARLVSATLCACFFYFFIWACFFFQLLPEFVIPSP